MRTESLAAAGQSVPFWKWNIAQAWAWAGDAWQALIHVPYLGLIALLLAAVVLLRALGRLLG